MKKLATVLVFGAVLATQAQAQDVVPAGQGANWPAIVENNGRWLELRHQVELEVAKTDELIAQSGNMPRECSASVLANLVTDPGSYDKQVNYALPHSRYPQNLTSVNSVLESERLIHRTDAKGQAVATIPSVYAVNHYLINHGVYTSTYDRNLDANLTGIVLPRYIVSFGRTANAKNSPQQVADDAVDLREATIKDITTLAYAIDQNPRYDINVSTFIHRSMDAYARNKVSCLYDVK
jgi:opacity protein-like surface antigen